jgi:hypothetical protein
LLVLPYMVFLSSRRSGRLNVQRLLIVVCLAALFGTAFVLIGQGLYAKRLHQAQAGDDPSFFYRVEGPAMAGVEVMQHYPFAGAGLTGEPFIEGQVVSLYASSSGFSTAWQIVSPATELLINYFWLHWIYLGIVFGVTAAVAVGMWMRLLGVPSVGFAMTTWAILGQASGAYVGPTCWAVLFLAGAASIMNQRPPAPPDGTFGLSTTLTVRLAMLRRGRTVSAFSEPPPAPEAAE